MVSQSAEAEHGGSVSLGVSVGVHEPLKMSADVFGGLCEPEVWVCFLGLRPIDTPNEVCSPSVNPWFRECGCCSGRPGSSRPWSGLHPSHACQLEMCFLQGSRGPGHGLWGPAPVLTPAQPLVPLGLGPLPPGAQCRPCQEDRWCDPGGPCWEMAQPLRGLALTSGLCSGDPAHGGQ